MSGFRLLDQFPVFLDRLGVPASGGMLAFFDTGTDTPKDVFGDPNLTVNNGSTVLIGSDGRTVVDVWGSGAYRVRLIDADSTLIKEADNVQLPGGAGTAIPALAAGKFLTNDGAVMSWDDILQVPDPTGSASKILGTDGVNLLWQAAPTVETPDVATGTFEFGGFLIQYGTGTAPATGTKRTAMNINFPKAFGEAPFVIPNPTAPINAAGLIGAYAAYGATTTGFSAQFDANLDNTSTVFTITSPVPFTWLAIGKAPA